MFAIAARSMGYRVWVLDPDPLSPAGAIADRQFIAAYDDPTALAELAAHCAAVTTEFENVPSETLQQLEQRLPVRPGSAAVEISRDRIREKTFIQDQGLATAPFFAIHNAAELDTAWEQLQQPALLKTARLGYDGKGQFTVTSLQDARNGFRQLGEVPCVLEQRVHLDRELSVILARSTRGETAVFPVGENNHTNGILDTTSVPARVPADIAAQATDMALRLAAAMQYCGVLAVEFFLTADGRLLVNEMAPRPHNSGHYTLDACLNSQFEQQVRTLCGLPPGAATLLSPVVMVNILGDLWGEQAPPWQHLFGHPQAKLHLYGKRDARPGRKMGHYSCVAETLEQCIEAAERIRTELSVTTS
jgi:5-(carboxyamino)imidazole ribonucleotide synthase